MSTVARGLNYMTIIDEMQPDNGEDVWDLTSRNIDRSVYYRPVWAGTQIPVEMIYLHNSSYDRTLLERHIIHQSHDTVMLDYMSYYDDVLLTIGRQHGKDYTLKKLSEKMMTDEYYESMRYKTLLPERVYHQLKDEFGEAYMSGALPCEVRPWNNREEKQEIFRRAYGLPDMSKVYGDPIEGHLTGRFATNARKD